jgi:hypothetical protein
VKELGWNLAPGYLAEDTIHGHRIPAGIAGGETELEPFLGSCKVGEQLPPWLPVEERPHAQLRVAYT